MGRYPVGVAVLTVNQLPNGSGGSTPSLPTKYVEVGESDNTVHCECIIEGCNSLTSTQIAVWSGDHGRLISVLA